MGGLFTGTAFGEAKGISRRDTKAATRMPPQFEELQNMLVGLLRGRGIASPGSGFGTGESGSPQPFFESPPTPQLSMTPVETQLAGLGQDLIRDVGVRPITEAFGSARGLAGTSVNLGDIAGEVTPLLSPAIQGVLTREGRDRRQIGEELTSQGAAIGSPLFEQQRLLQEGTNRSIAEMVSNAVLQERQLRGGERVEGGRQLQTLGLTAPQFAQTLAALPREIQLRQFDLEQQNVQNRMAGIQQVLDLFAPGLGAGASAFGTQSAANIARAEIGLAAQQQQDQAINDSLSSIISIAGLAAMSTEKVKKEITPLDPDEYTKAVTGAFTKAAAKKSDEYSKALDRVRETPIVRYRYKWEDDQKFGAPHIGPILELSPEEIRHPNKVQVRMLDYLGLQHAAMKGLDKNVRHLTNQLRRAVRVKDAKAA